MRQWKETEKRMKKTNYGKIKEISLIIGMHPFFNESVAAVMLSLAVSLPYTNCNIHITIWFLYAGITSNLTIVFDNFLKDAKDMAASDGTINRKEYYVINSLIFCKLLLFMIEIVVYCGIAFKTIGYSGDIILDKKVAQDTARTEFYCERGPWNMMMLVSILYCVVLVFRVIVIIADLVGVKGGENVRDNDAPEGD